MPLDHGVDERAERRVGVDAVDEQPVHDAELRGGEPDPERVVHQPAHALDLVGELIVEARRPAARAVRSTGIAEHADVPERRVAARAGSGSSRSGRRRRLALASLLAIGRRALSAPSAIRPATRPRGPQSPSARRHLLRVDVDAERDVAQRAVARGATRPRRAVAAIAARPLGRLDHDLARARARAAGTAARARGSRCAPRRRADRAATCAAAARSRLAATAETMTGSGRRTAGSAARAGARARRRGSPRCRAARRPRSRARRARSSARARGRPAARGRRGRRAGRSARTCAPRRGSRGSAACCRRRARRRA